jgi:hypothetical protein
MSSRAKRWVMSGSGLKRPDSTVALSLPACALCRPDSFPDPLSFQFFRRRGHLADCQQLLRQSNDLMVPEGGGRDDEARATAQVGLAVDCHGGWHCRVWPVGDAGEHSPVE